MITEVLVLVFVGLGAFLLMIGANWLLDRIRELNDDWD